MPKNTQQVVYQELEQSDPCYAQELENAPPPAACQDTH
jgi:hypothetical protein